MSKTICFIGLISFLPKLFIRHLSGFIAGCFLFFYLKLIIILNVIELSYILINIVLIN